MMTAAQAKEERDSALASEIISHFMSLNTDRSQFAMQWEEVAALVRPNSRNTFMYGNYNTPGVKKTERQIDASGMAALSRFGAICDSLMTPQNQIWHSLAADDDALMKDRQTKLWFEAATKALFKLRYSPTANFVSQNQQNYQELGAFGNMGMFVDKLYSVTGQRGIRYKSMPIGELFLIENHQGAVEGFIRWFRLLPHQVMKQFPDTCPEGIRNSAEKNSQTPCDILHYVAPNVDYDERRLDAFGKLYKSCYVSIEGKKLLSESGYNSLPIAASRYNQGPGERYGRGPAMDVLPALKTLNAEKGVFLKQGHRAADPILLLLDDGLMDMNVTPGAFNKGGWSAEGKPLVGTLPVGDINVTKEMMDEERVLIDQAFLTDLFKILLDDPKIYTATQITEMAAQRGILIAPTLGRQQSEYLGPLIDRELDLAAEMGMLPPMPPLLREAGGQYKVKYTSPLAKQMRAQEVAGAMRTIDTTINIVNITGDPEPLDNFDFDVIIPEMADIQGTPASWMASMDKIQARRQQRAQTQQMQMQIQAAPGAAAMMKAQAATGQQGA